MMIDMTVNHIGEYMMKDMKRLITYSYVNT